MRFDRRPRPRRRLVVLRIRAWRLSRGAPHSDNIRVAQILAMVVNPRLLINSSSRNRRQVNSQLPQQLVRSHLLQIRHQIKSSSNSNSRMDRHTPRHPPINLNKGRCQHNQNLRHIKAKVNLPQSIVKPSRRKSRRRRLKPMRLARSQRLCLRIRRVPLTHKPIRRVHLSVLLPRRSSNSSLLVQSQLRQVRNVNLYI